jgi:hypothetical protein
MPSPSTLTYWEGLVLIVGLCGIVFWRLLKGDISMDGLLEGDVRDKTSSSGFRTEFSPGRSQLLMFTIVTAGYYLLQVIHNPRTFPQIPVSWVAALGGSHALFLAGKAKSMLLGQFRDLINRRTS